jgi:magnesium chelatase family protein
VEAARARQERRAARSGVRLNAELAGRALREACALPAGGKQLLAAALRRRGLSARAIHRVLRVSRTIADLEGSPDVGLPHLAEAVRYRVLPDGSVFGDGP